LTLVSLKTGSDGGIETAKLELLDGSHFYIKACYLDDRYKDISSWEAGRELDDEEIDALSFASACSRAEKAAMRLIARAEQRRWGLQAKLEHRGFDSACVKAVIMRFLDLGLLNDRRYAEIWLRNRLERRAGKVPGPRELTAMLQNRGIDRETASLALQEVLDEEKELSLLERFLAKKGPSMTFPAIRPQLRAKGFSPEVITRYFDE
jgi:regulatory protein